MINFLNRKSTPQKLRIIKAIITNSEGKKIIMPNKMIINKEEIETYRLSLKTEPDARVILTYEEYE